MILLHVTGESIVKNTTCGQTWVVAPYRVEKKCFTKFHSAYSAVLHSYSRGWVRQSIRTFAVAPTHWSGSLLWFAFANQQKASAGRSPAEAPKAGAAEIQKDVIVGHRHLRHRHLFIQNINPFGKKRITLAVLAPLKIIKGGDGNSCEGFRLRILVNSHFGRTLWHNFLHKSL